LYWINPVEVRLIFEAHGGVHDGATQDEAWEQIHGACGRVNTEKVRERYFGKG
jgi:hypothetical protein